jgi:putative transposase
VTANCEWACNRRLSLATADMGCGELPRKLAEKAAWRGGQVMVVDLWYPSSKTYSCGGYRLKSLSLNKRQWTCPGGELHDDRDSRPCAQEQDEVIPAKRESSGKAALSSID